MTNIAKTLLIITVLVCSSCVEYGREGDSLSAYDEETMAISIMEQDPSVLLSDVEEAKLEVTDDSKYDIVKFNHDSMSSDSLTVNVGIDFNNRDTLMARIINAYLLVESLHN